MKNYTVRVECIAFKDFEIEAENDREAREMARNSFRCMGGVECTEAEILTSGENKE